MPKPPLKPPELDFFRSQHAPYYISIGPYRQTSMGIRMMHTLAHVLNSLGFEAYVSTDESSPKLRTPPLSPAVLRAHIASNRYPIKVLPESMIGNTPSTVPGVDVRWILGTNQKKLAAQGVTMLPVEDHELIFYWDKVFLDDELVANKSVLEPLMLNVYDETIFHPHTVGPRSGFCYYAHKYLGQGSIDPRLVRDGVSLCQNIPRSHMEIADILRTSRVLYCYEESAIVGEAILCGCPVVLIQSRYAETYCGNFSFDKLYPGMFVVSEAELDTTYVPAFEVDISECFKDTTQAQINEQINRFIEITQAAAKQYQAEHPPWTLPKVAPTPPIDLAIAAFNQDDRELAIERFSALLASEPDNPLPAAYLAFLSARQGLVDSARDFIVHALKIAPGRFDLVAALGEVWLKEARPELALACIEEATTENPELFAAYPAQARALRQLGRSDDAVALLNGVVNIASDWQTSIRNELTDTLREIEARRVAS